MTVTASDISLQLSGGSGNSDPALSLGGSSAGTEVTFSPILNNLFDNVSASEAISGAVEYRCVYISNDHATDDLDSVKIWISSDTPSSGTSIAIGLDPVGKNGAPAAISPSSSAPSGVTFSAPTTEGAGLDVGLLEAGDVYAFWVRRTVNASTASTPNDAFAISYSGTPL